MILKRGRDGTDSEREKASEVWPHNSAKETPSPFPATHTFTIHCRAQGARRAHLGPYSHICWQGYHFVSNFICVLKCRTWEIKFDLSGPCSERFNFLDMLYWLTKPLLEKYSVYLGVKSWRLRDTACLCECSFKPPGSYYCYYPAVDYASAPRKQVINVADKSEELFKRILPSFFSRMRYACLLFIKLQSGVAQGFENKWGVELQVWYARNLW